MTRLTVDDYTVAWICALPLEAAAARAMLDKTHGSPRRPHDSNAYDFGELNGHYIAIAYLPDGVYGTVSAATVASRMHLTFRRLQFALMVGIGGGVPSKSHDIRLGDIVVGKPGKNHGGVVQYDYGNAIQGGQLEQTGFLNQPPQTLLTHMSQLESKQLTGRDNTISNLVSAAVEHNQDMKTTFSAPAQATDLLFHPSYHHADKAASCERCDKEQSINREPRATSAPRVHYGLIASGNQVMKDSEARDRLAERHEILCFEMEASGLVNELPTLVIRGICDYCDSHKNDEWQGYAALAAAAYAKKLLSIIPPEEGTVRQGQGIQFTEEEQACLAKLFFTEPEEEMNSLKRGTGDRASGTCSWFLETTELKSWFRQKKSVDVLERNVLWVYGNPGIGKSTMAMTLAQEIPTKGYFADGDNILSIVFCEADSEHQTGATSMLRGLIYQIVDQYPAFMKVIMSKYKTRGETFFASFDALWALLMDMGRAVRGPEIYCIIDALDECEPQSQEMLLDQIVQSFSKPVMPGSEPFRLHMLIISRPSPEIRSCLSVFNCVDLGLSNELKSDLRAMIKDTVKELAKRNNYPPSVAQEVSRIFEDKADGTFLWVGIAYKEMRSVPSRNAVRKLRALPRGLYSLYRKLLDAATATATACSPDDYRAIRKIMEIVAFARRPLTLAEIAEACRLYLDLESSSRLHFTKEVIDLCHFLVVVDKGQVRMLHRSVHEFLMLEIQDINPARSNYALSHRCIEIVLQYCGPDISPSVLEPNHSFLAYSVLHWPEHAALSQTEFTLPNEQENFFKDHLGAWRWWLDRYNYLTRGTWNNLDMNTSASHVAARWGIIPLISFLLPDNLEVKDAQRRTPLLVAAEHSQLEAIHVLVGSGARVDILNNEHQSVLHILCSIVDYTDLKLTRKLLDQGVSPYSCDENNMTPFFYAVGNSNEELVRLFLQNGFDVTTQIQRRLWPGRTTVSPITSADPEEAARETIESGLTSLHFSALNGCSQMTAFLMQHGADPNARSRLGDTPLHLAIRSRLLGRECHDAWTSGRYAMELLTEVVTDFETEEASKITKTIDQARISIVETLVKSQTTDVNIANACGDCAQHVIEFRKHDALSILSKLIENGADISRLNGSRQTCLHLASKAGNLGVVRRLVGEGQDILLEDIHRLSPFHYALKEGYSEVLQYMSQTCDQVLLGVWNTLDRHGRTPLHHHVSSVFPYIDVIDFLTQAGCDVNQPDEGGNTSLCLYLGSFHLGVERPMFSHLVQKGADPLRVNKQQQNLLHLLMRHRGANKGIFEDLLNCGLDPAARDADGMTFMHHGAIHGAFTEELVGFLRCKGVLGLQTRDSTGKTPLDYAQEKAHQEFPENIVVQVDQKWETSFNALTAVTRTVM
ncbi:hypothetical protein P875_00010100 [Aspergillus parasiticus SU-1]|uniref:Uncharacterized protein n=1 Tax=Aspergillus parasiticus (strain ATCC 56775 / NRRL 5862 / SRRC 143 / SU-1) TaxID=1403190 RepID=A0A0F0IDA3_ASPPU|nr:hypothetical protein P875_00010100 [Aspergillus parasiticus SU-1]